MGTASASTKPVFELRTRFTDPKSRAEEAVWDPASTASPWLSHFGGTSLLGQTPHQANLLPGTPRPKEVLIIQ
jgi:hypothetical protein